MPARDAIARSVAPSKPRSWKSARAASRILLLLRRPRASRPSSARSAEHSRRPRPCLSIARTGPASAANRPAETAPQDDEGPTVAGRAFGRLLANLPRLEAGRLGLSGLPQLAPETYGEVSRQRATSVPPRVLRPGV